MKTLYILLPGNPSVPGVYDRFLDTVVESSLVSGEYHKVILPHLGQCNQGKFKGKRVTLEQVLDDHRSSILNLIEEHRPTKTVLIGHSFGSAVTIELYQEFQNDIDEFIVICPFLGPSGKNKTYLKMFKNPISRLGMKSASHSILLSRRFSESFFKRWLGENPYNSHIPQEIKKPRYIKNFFSLVSEYIDEFPKLGLEQKLEKMCPKKCFFLFAEQDFWVPKNARLIVPQGAKVQVCSEITHDFCLKKSEYLIVADAISFHLSR